MSWYYAVYLFKTIYKAYGNLYHKKVGHFTFRDPAKGTENFILSLYDKDDICFYSSSSLKDPYQFAYHRMVAYRENCYHCRYANSQRISDITLSDYKGLGVCSPCNFSEKKLVVYWLIQ